MTLRCFWCCLRAQFTPRGINTTVGPDQEVTFQYRLIVDAQQLDTVDYRLVLTVFYDDDNEPFTSTFFNDTRKFFYPPTPTDTRQLAMYGVGALAAALVAMIVMRGSGSSGSKRSSGGADGADDSFAGDRGHMPSKVRVVLAAPCHMSHVGVAVASGAPCACRGYR